MKVTALLRVGRNVGDLDSAAAFYAAGLGFRPLGPVIEDFGLAQSLGVQRVRLLRLRLGAQEIELSECHPQGAVYPRGLAANHPGFQHIAIVTGDIASAYGKVMRHGAAAISRDGPVRLPVASGGVAAFKFRDLDGHPLEFLEFPGAARAPGFDHSALCVSNIQQAVAFYAQLGLTLTAQQVNHGPEQDALDGLADVAVDVLALHPPLPAPHVELLHYRTPSPPATAPYGAADLCADRLIFTTSSGAAQWLRDPDGHFILLRRAEF
jgi:catechol 2,3-dioxygenase-like lactoylglutathione lyase family enzyme